MPLESPPISSGIDHSQLDEFLGFSYAASPELALPHHKNATLSSQHEFLGFSYVDATHSLKVKDEMSDRTRYSSDGHENYGYTLGHLSSEDECVHPIADDLVQLILKD